MNRLPPPAVVIDGAAPAVPLAIEILAATITARAARLDEHRATREAQRL